MAIETKILVAFQHLDVLKDLPADFQHLLAPFAAFRTLRKGETLFCQGEPSPYCFGILRGEVTLTRHDSASVIVYRPGQILGGNSLLMENARPGAATVSADGEVLAIWASRFRTWVETQRSVAGEPAVLSALRSAFSQSSSY